MLSQFIEGLVLTNLINSLLVKCDIGLLLQKVRFFTLKISTKQSIRFYRTTIRTITLFMAG